MSTNSETGSAERVRSFVSRYMEVHGAETHGVRAELEQLQTILVDAVQSLTSAFEEMSAQLERIELAAAQTRHAGTGAIAMDDSPSANGGVEKSFGKAMTALQFHDIASQILRHAERRIHLLERMAGQLQQLPDTTIEELDRVLSNACAVRGHNPVAQTILTVGAMELF